MKKFFPANRGQATVEMALLLPILLILLLGIMEIGRVFAGYIELQNAARDGTRYAAVHNVVYADSSVVKNYVSDRFVILDKTKLGDPGNFQYYTKTTTGPPPERWVEVILNYPMEINTPIISDLTGSPINLHVKMAMRSE